MATAAATAAALFSSGMTAPAGAAPSTGPFTVSVTSSGTWSHPTDTPAGVFIDKNGSFYFQQSAALYGASDPRYWDFFSGTDFDSATRNSSMSNAVNPANSNDKNNDTTWRCNNSPTGLEATSAPSTASYAHRNYCDLAGVWVDPDTGDWYGLVHNEFTPQPFGDGLHYDAIDHAVSTDQGKTWKINGHAITSPYSTKRGDNVAFPNQTYDYGDGDQRLFVDAASGYFYVLYGSRIVDKNGGWKAFYSHAARAPISGKMATGTWQKWYGGGWGEPGVGGRESNMVPVTAGNTNGYTPTDKEYSPLSTGTVTQQVAAGTAPATSPLFVMDITYNAYLGLYIGEPQAVDQSGNAPQEFYATDNLATQKWTKIGDSGSQTNASWYRWFLDSTSKTSSTIVGKNFRSYCSFGCTGGSSGRYWNMTITAANPATAPFDPSKTYTIGTAEGRVLSQAASGTSTTSAAPTGATREAWAFAPTGDGAYTIVNSGTGAALGVGTTTGARAWGTKPIVTAISGSPAVGQQWFILENKTTAGASTGTFRLVNRYSGLVLALSGVSTRLAETTPARAWTNTTGNTVGSTRTAAEQTLTITAAGSAQETVTVVSPGPQSATVGKPVSVQVTGADSLGKPLTYSATGLPAGLSISASGLITGSPTASGTSTATVTASSGTATGSTTIAWSVNADLSGIRTLTASGKALDNPNSSTANGTQLITWAPGTQNNQKWNFSLQSDGSYQITNVHSGLCMDVNGGFTTAGTAIIQWTCGGGANQRWVVNALTGGGYSVTAKHSGLLLTTASTTNGALVTQQTDTGSALQRWTIS
ncbi:RICIN domain-containing protein [Actinocorallia lasiicapitis]